MGTSLTVQPFASLVDFCSDHCVRLLINRDKVGKTHSGGFFRSMMFGEGLCFDLPGNRRDVAYEIECDDGCLYLADQFGFGDELRAMIEKEHARIDGKNTATGEVTELAEGDSDKEVAQEKPEDEQSKERLLKTEKKVENVNE